MVETRNVKVRTLLISGVVFLILEAALIFCLSMIKAEDVLAFVKSAEMIAPLISSVRRCPNLPGSAPALV